MNMKVLVQILATLVIIVCWISLFLLPVLA